MDPHEGWRRRVVRGGAEWGNTEGKVRGGEKEEGSDIRGVEAVERRAGIEKEKDREDRRAEGYRRGRIKQNRPYNKIFVTLQPCLRCYNA